MKVKHNAEYRKYFTLEDYERSKRVIAFERDEDEITPRDWAEYAVREAIADKEDYLVKVIEATAETAKNCRACDEYFEGSADMDVWISALAKTTCGYIEVGAYLSDIWHTGSVIYKQHMFIEYYTREA